MAKIARTKLQRIREHMLPEHRARASELKACVSATQVIGTNERPMLEKDSETKMTADLRNPRALAFFDHRKPAVSALNYEKSFKCFLGTVHPRVKRSHK